MPFKTKLNEDVLNIIFNYADIKANFNYYKQTKKSKQGFRSIKLVYKCTKCNKKIRNISDKIYGFILYHYRYYFIKSLNINRFGTKRYYHPKNKSIINDDGHQVKGFTREFLEILESLVADIRENNYCISIRIPVYSEDDKKFLGKCILRSFNDITTHYDKFNKYKRNLQSQGIIIKEPEMISKDKFIKKVKLEMLNLNKDLKPGYYCSMCVKKTSYYDFVKL